MKPCNKCKTIKPLNLFYNESKKKDGKKDICKECCQTYNNTRDKEKHKISHIKYNSSTKGKKAHNRIAKEWVKRNKEKRIAHILIGNYLATKRITKKPCRVCGNKLTHGHHEDYNKPLEVIWLCSRHHKQLHKSFEAYKKLGGI